MNAFLQSLLERWRALAPREQRLLTAGSAAVLATVVFLGAIEPLAKSRTRHQAALESSRALAQRLEQIAAEVQSSRGSAPNAALRSLSLLSAVDQSSKQSALGKPLTRVQPDGDKRVKVWVENASFDALIQWVHELESRYGVFTESADIERESANGQISAQLSLVRP